MLAQNRFIQFVAEGGPVTIQSVCSFDVDLYVYRHGVMLEAAATESGNEQLSFSSSAGDTYVVNVQGWGENSESYSAVISILP